MSSDMSTSELTKRQRQIVQVGIEIIASEGYASLSMRALARASGLKLGALQYHFRTWEDFMRGLAGLISEEYRRSFDVLAEKHGLRETVRFLLYDGPADATLQAYKLFPQLWAMAQVEPVVRSLLDDIYSQYLEILEEGFAEAGSRAPRAEALALMAVAEGSAIFLDRERLWARDAKDVRDAVYGLICAKYPDRKEVDS